MPGWNRPWTTPADSGPHPVHGWVTGPDGSPWNAPNAVTLVRTVGAVCLAVAAITQRSLPLAVAAYLTYWLGDVLDGVTARALGQETRFGAVLDIVADRACAGLCVAALLVLDPGAALPCAVFLVQFLVLDCQLSLAFLRWPLLSPNYFHLVHRRVHRWNWWPPAKALNTTALVLAVLLLDPVWYATGVALALTAVKAWSLVVVHRLPVDHTPPGVTGPATPLTAPL